MNLKLNLNHLGLFIVILDSKDQQVKSWQERQRTHVSLGEALTGVTCNVLSAKLK